MYRVDLNCDLGESFGVYPLGNDEEILSVVTSANIACGYHAGDPATMRRTVHMALQRGVGIGAHPGLPDLAGFGRRKMDITPREAYDMTVYQIGALGGFVRACGASLQHVKPHGALYNMAAVNRKLAEAIAEAVYDLDGSMMLFGLAGSELVKAAERIGLQTAHEVFADRTYQANGTLTPRSHPHALLTDPEQSVEQVLRMVMESKVRALSGEDVTIQADTICLHGDGPHALDFARRIRDRLEAADILVEGFRMQEM
ncbi:LamB/YcsF family protein [Tumebacillus sp. ITR2]|uniref:5-oxoprolinase subunit A n=1 Tax=Tumebacillus amylolyticus TaxID=2801339 RepID=A0ABS1JAA3_9BACL|nr:5-oxoprolinase subunit PxpA [Tumebacillus amylolyticus]MBL0387110.1 LamB/YcsF family protein [Tumebacillus amylolyticus]